MTSIIIQRKNEFLNKLMDYHIILDGKNIGTISNGQTKEFKTTVGQHALKAELAWCSSPLILITVNEDEKKVCIVKANDFSKFTTTLGIFTVLLFLLLNCTVNLKYIYATLFSTPFFLFIFYNTTIRRKKYLHISCM